MAVLQSQWITRERSTRSSFAANDVIVNRAEFVIGRGETLDSGDILEISLLPAFHRLLSMEVITDNLGTDVTGQVGIVSGEAGDGDTTRTVEDTLIQSLDMSTDGNTVIDDDRVLRQIGSTDNHRSIGVLLDGDVAASDDDEPRLVRIVMSYTPFAV